MKPFHLASAGVLVAFVLFSPAAAYAATSFNDSTCPNVTPLGQHLNDLVDTSKTLSDELVGAAQAMVDGYRTCKRGYDDNTYNNRAGGTGTSVTDGNVVGRLYARLALARSLQRIGIYAVDGKKYADARTAFSDAMKNLDEMSTIDVGSLAFSDSTEHRLLTEGRELENKIRIFVDGIPAQ